MESYEEGTLECGGARILPGRLEHADNLHARILYWVFFSAQVHPRDFANGAALAKNCHPPLSFSSCQVRNGHFRWPTVDFFFFERS